MTSKSKQLKRLWSLALLLVLMCLPQTMWAGGTKPSGLGTDTDPYLITNEANLIWFRDAVNGAIVNSSSKAKLTNDITLTSEWTPIGTDQSPYKGVFYGQFHNITGMTINCKGSNQGLFGYINGAKLQNFVVSGTVTSNTAGLGSIGGAVGCGLNSTLNNVTSNVNISIGKGIGNSHVGGVVGHADGVKFDHCTNNGTIDAGASNDCIGGIAGYAAGASKFDYCNNTGDITSSNGNATIGGIMGYNNSSGFLGAHICLNSGKISGGTADTNAGAIYGRLKESSSGLASGNYYLEGSATKGVGNDVSGKVAADAIVAKSKDEYFHYQNWTLVGVRYGSCTVTDNTVISFYGLNNSSWGDNSIQTGDYFGGNGNKGTVFWTGTVPNANSKFIAITAYTHSETIPSYTSLKRTSTYKVVMATDRFVHGASLYMFETLSSAFATALDAMPGQDEASMVGCPNRILKATDNNGNHSWTSATYTTTYDNSTSPGARTLSKYLDLMHVNNSGDLSMISTTGSQEWVGFQEESTYTDVWSYYAIVTFDANGGTGTMSNQVIENSGTLTSNAFTLTNYIFTGWNTQADGSGTAYAAGATFTATSTNKGPITLYAQWEILPVPMVPVYKEDGTTVDYYEIHNAEQLMSFAKMVNSGQTKINAKLVDNIDMSTVCHAADESKGVAQMNWTPIGNKSNIYSGTFDGDNHTISNLYVNNSSATYIGLIGFASGATIKNVGVVDANIKGNTNVSGVCGYNYNKSSISNCYATGTVSGTNYVGGVCGNNNSSTISNCYATATVSGGNIIGGVCGYNSNKSTITNCYAIGAVSGDDYVGGVCGTNDNSTISNCYTTQQTPVGDSSSTETCVEGNVTLKRFQSGEIAWKLNGSIVDGTWTAGPTTGSQAWYQTLPAAGSGETGTSLPVLTKAADASNYVYPYTKYACDGTTVKSSGYCNDANATTATHEYDDKGLCKYCDALQPPTPVYKADGTVDYYAIGNVAQLYWFADKVNNDNNNYKSANARLTNDIVVNEGTFDANGKWSEIGTPRSWTPIGKGYVTSNETWYKFCGTFDGDGHTISGLYFNDSSTSYVGLFGYTFGAIIQNVGVVNSYFKGCYGVGGVCGESCYTTITNCYATGTVSGDYNVGGVCGCNNSSTISNCYATGTVSGSKNVGGVCGDNYDSSITNCYATGTVSGTGDYVGGVCGENNNNSTITNCYATGTVSGTSDYVGGVCGENNNNSTITNCYATGTVSGRNDVGGVCGENFEYSTITGCYATGTVSGSQYIGGLCGWNNENSTISNCYTTQATTVGESDENCTVNCVEGNVTLERFKSGEICWLLNDSRSAGTEDNPLAWYQKLGTNGDDYPVLTKASDGSNTVYYDESRTPAYYNLASPGDINADGNITIADLTLLVEILNGRATDTNSAADVDGNGSITTEDANALSNKILEVK